MKTLLSLSLVAAFAIFAACTKKEEAAPTTAAIAPAGTPAATTDGGAPGGTGGAKTTLPGGIIVEDVVVGTGAEAVAGKKVAVHYSGYLTDGKKFDSSLDRGKDQHFKFALGAGQVIQGWDKGVAGMKVGGKRKLTIPPEMGYGAAGAGGGLIPPNATLIFDVELFGVE